MISDNAGLAPTVFRVAQSIIGALTVLIVAKFYNPEMQGYYFLILNIASFTAFFDFGMSSVLVVASAHALSQDNFKGMSMAGVVPETNLVLLARYAVNWGIRAAILAFLVIVPLGIWFISSSDFSQGSEWILPFITLVLFTSLAMFINYIFAILEGLAIIKEIYSVKVIQIVGGFCVFLIVLLTTGSMYAATMAPLMFCIIGTIWLVIYKTDFLRKVFVFESLFLVNRKLLSLQLRSTLGWFAGYSLVLIYIPIIFILQGPESSGRFAISMNIVNTICLISASLLMGRIPLISRSLAAKEWGAADLLFVNTLRKSIVIYLCGGFAIITFRYFLTFTEYNQRLLPIYEFIILTIGMFFYNLTALFAAYLRAYLKDPLAKILFIVSILSIPLIYIVAEKFGTYGIVLFVFIVNLTILLPITLYLSFHFRRVWQTD